jgi:hypothetical protein
MVGVASNTVSFTSITLGLLLVMVRIAIKNCHYELMPYESTPIFRRKLNKLTGS